MRRNMETCSLEMMSSNCRMVNIRDGENKCCLVNMSYKNEVI